MIHKETQELIDKIVVRWDELKVKHFPFANKEEYSSEVEDTVIGKIWWNNPNLIWILSTRKEEDYEGSQSQIGIAKDGTLRWEYQSHCSCNSYEDSKELPEQFTVESLKSFDFTHTEPPLDWENEMKRNMEKILTS